MGLEDLPELLGVARSRVRGVRVFAGGCDGRAPAGSARGGAVSRPPSGSCCRDDQAARAARPPENVEARPGHARPERLCRDRPGACGALGVSSLPTAPRRPRRGPRRPPAVRAVNSSAAARRTAGPSGRTRTIGVTPIGRPGGASLEEARLERGPAGRAHERRLVVQDHAHRNRLEERTQSSLGGERVEERPAPERREDPGRDPAPRYTPAVASTRSPRLPASAP